jgi:hypothetical protein
MFTAIVLAYILSRGIARAGSREGPFVGTGTGIGRQRTETFETETVTLETS